MNMNKERLTAVLSTLKEKQKGIPKNPGALYGDGYRFALDLAIHYVEEVLEEWKS